MPIDVAYPRSSEQTCEKCGSATEIVSFIARFGDQPAYRIFECDACKALMWIAGAISK